jgi:xanthosine phosphorylase
MQALQTRLPANFAPKLGLILGSGLSEIANQMTHAVSIAYADIPGLQTGSVHSHKSLMIAGYLNDKPIICMSGRLHYYEGAAATAIQLLVRLIKRLGADTVIVTGAVGSLRLEMQPGEVVMLSDHINLQGCNPLVGVNDEAIGARFPDMQHAYDITYRTLLKKIAADNHITLHEGIYISVLGPSLETPAEIRAFRLLGADVIGMSVVPEVIVARHCGLKVIGLMAVSNFAVGLTEQPIDHSGIIQYAHKAGSKLSTLIKKLIVEITV